MCVYVYIYVCICVYIYVCICVYIYVYMCIYMYIYIYIYIYIYVCVYRYRYICVCVYVYICICVCVCGVCVCVCVCVCIYIYTVYYLNYKSVSRVWNARGIDLSAWPVYFCLLLHGFDIFKVSLNGWGLFVLYYHKSKRKREVRFGIEADGDGVVWGGVGQIIPLMQMHSLHG